MGSVKRVSKKRNNRWTIVAIFSFFISLFCVSAWFVSNAWFRDRDEMIDDVDTAAIQLENNSQYSMSTVVNLALADQYLLEDDVTFNITEKSSEVYVRCALKFSCTDGAEVAKDMIKFQDFELGTNAGYSWQQFGEYFYLCDEAGVPKTIERSQAGQIFTFVEKDKLLLPRDAIVGKHFTSRDKVVMTVEVEAIQGRNLDDSSIFELNQYYLGEIPTNTYSVVFHNTDGSVLSEQTSISYGGHAAVPEIEKVKTSEHKTFAYWSTTEDGDGLKVREADENRVFSNISQNMQLWPVYLRDQVKIDVVQNENGTITPGSTTIDWGTGKTFRVVADSGHEITQIKRDGVVIYDFTGSKLDMFDYKLENVVADTQIEASFTPVVYDITVITVGNGTINPGSTTAVFGSSKVFTITPDEGYRIWSINLDGLEETVTATSGNSQRYTLSNISSDHILSVKFVRSVLKITTTAGDNGTIRPTELEVEYNSFASVSIVPNEGYEISAIYIDGVQMNSAQVSKNGVAQNISFENVIEDHHVQAYFSKLKLKISSSAGEGGTISPNDPNGEIEYVYGTSATFEILPDAQKTIDQIFVDGAAVAVTVTEGEKQTYVFENLTDSHTISATFKRSFIKLDINGGTGKQPTISYSIDGTKFTLSSIEPTGPAGKEFYYYSTRAYDNEKGQIGDRYDLGFEYDIPDMEATTTLYAIYLEPTQNLSVYSTYMVFPKGTTIVTRIGLQEAINEAFEAGEGNGLAQFFTLLVVMGLSTSQRDTNLVYCTLPAGLTSLDWYAFCGCASLTGVSVPASLATIGMSAFSTTPNLKSFTIPYSCVSIGQGVFQDSGVSEIKMNKKLRTIGAYAFKNSNIKEFKIPSTVTEMGATDSTYQDKELVDGVFESCAKLEKIDFSEQSSFHGQTLKNCISLTQVILPNPTTAIPASQFEGCSSLSYVSYLNGETLVNKFPSTLKTIGDKAFYGCAFTELHLDDCSKVTLGNYAFCDNNFTSLLIEEGKLKSIGENAFSNCVMLETLVWQATLGIPNSCFVYCSKLQSVSITSIKDSIGSNAFLDCSKLNSLTLATAGKTFEILDSAFQNCSITTISLPEGLTSIKSCAFFNNNFDVLVFPKSLTQLYDDALQNCTSLTKFTLQADLSSNIESFVKVGNGGPWYVEGEPYVVGHNLSSAPNGIGPKATYTTTPGKAQDVEWEWVEILEDGKVRTYTSSSTAKTTTSSVKSATYLGTEVGKKYLTKFIPSSLDAGDLTIIAPTALIDYNAVIHEISGLISFDVNDVAKTKIMGSDKISLEIASGMNYIGENCFNNDQGKNLFSITLPISTEYIGANAFNGTAISSVYVPNLTYIGASAFANCTALKSVQLSNLITEIPNGCFQNSGVASFVTPQYLQKIGNNAFESTSIIKIYLPAPLSEIGSQAFISCEDLTTVEGLSNTKLSAISSQTFKNCSSLTKTYLPSTVISISESAFENCSNLKNVTFGSSLETIGENAFASCSTISTLEFPQTLKTISVNAFNACSNLIKITFDHSAMTTSTLSVGADSFAGTPATLCIYIQTAIQLSNFQSIFNGTSVDKGFAENATLFYQNTSNPLAVYISKEWKKVYTVKIVCGEGGSANAKFGDSEPVLIQSNQDKFFYVVSGMSYNLIITPDKTTQFFALVINGTKVSVANDSTNSDVKLYSGSVSGDATMQVTFNKPVVVLDENGANGTNFKKHTITEGANKESFTINADASNYTKNGRPFYFYSTVSSDNESKQTGKRFDVGVTYPISTLTGLNSNVLYAIYLTPTAESNFTFSNGTISLTASAKNSTITNLVIPQTIGGVAVTAIAKCGFTNVGESGLITNQSIISGLITMPSSIKTIGARAFAGNYQIKNIFSLPYNLTTLGDEAFALCQEAAISINIMTPNSNVVKFDNAIIYTTGGVHQLALGATYSKEVGLLDSTTILPHAFAKSTITTFQDMGKITKYGAYAFANCGQLQKVTFAKKASEVTFGAGVFEQTTAMLRIYTPRGDVDNYITKLDRTMGFNNGALIYDGPESTIPYAQYYNNAWHKIYKVTTKIEGVGGMGISIINSSAQTPGVDSKTFTFENYRSAFGENITGKDSANCEYGYFREDWNLDIIISSNSNSGHILNTLVIKKGTKQESQTIQSTGFNAAGDRYTFGIPSNTRKDNWEIIATFNYRKQNITVYLDDNLSSQNFSLALTKGTKQTSGDFTGLIPNTTEIQYNKAFTIKDITPKSAYSIVSFKYRYKSFDESKDQYVWGAWTNVDISGSAYTSWTKTKYSGAFNSIKNYNFQQLTEDIEIVVTTQNTPFIVHLNDHFVPMCMEYKDNQYKAIQNVTLVSSNSTSVTIPNVYENESFGARQLYYFLNNGKRFDTGIAYATDNFAKTDKDYYVLFGEYFIPLTKDDSKFVISGGTFTIKSEISGSSTNAIPKGVSTITIENSKYGFYQLSNLVLPKTVTKICCGAFAMSKISSTIYFPTNLKTIEEGGLTTTSTAIFKQTRVGNGYGFEINSTYLTTNSGKTLISAYSMITPSSIPAGVTKLGAYLFAGRNIGEYSDENNSVTSYGVGVFFDTAMAKLTFSKSSGSVTFDGKLVNSTSKINVHVSSGEYMTKLNGLGFMSYNKDPNGGANPYSSMYLLSGDKSLYAIYYYANNLDSWNRTYFYTHNTNVNAFEFKSNNTKNEFYDNNNTSKIYIKNNSLSYTLKGINQNTIKKIDYFKYENGVKSTTVASTKDDFDLTKTGVDHTIDNINLSTIFGSSVHIEISTNLMVVVVNVKFNAMNSFDESFMSSIGYSMSEIFNVQKMETNSDSNFVNVGKSIDGNSFSFYATYKSNVVIRVSQIIKDSIFTLGENGDKDLSKTIYVESLSNKEMTITYRILPINLDVNYGTSTKGIDNNINYLINAVGIKKFNSKYSFYYSITDPDMNLTLDSAECYYFSNSPTAVDFSDDRYDFGLVYKYDFELNNLSRSTLYARFAKAILSSWEIVNNIIQYKDTKASGIFYSGNSGVTKDILVVPKDVKGELIESISSQTFTNNLTGVKYVILPNSCVTLGRNAFSYSSIERIQLPANFELESTIPNVDANNNQDYATPFINLNNCKYVSINTCYDTQTYSVANKFISYGGAVYNKSKAYLIYHPALLPMSDDTLSWSTITQIMPYACQNCSIGSIEKISFNDLKRIREYAFENCSTIGSLITPMLQTVEKFAFSYSSVYEVTTDKLEHIGQYAFQYSKIKTIFKSKSTAYSGILEEGAFFNCTKLQGTIYIDSMTIGDRIFANESYPSGLTKNQKSFSIQFDNLTQLGNEVFKNSYINKLTFSDNFVDFWIDNNGNIVDELSLSYFEDGKSNAYKTTAYIINKHVKVNYGSNNFYGAKNLQYVFNWSSLKDIVDVPSVYFDTTLTFEYLNGNVGISNDYLSDYRNFISSKQVFGNSPLISITFNNNAKYIGAHSMSMTGYGEESEIASLQTICLGDSVAAVGNFAFYRDSLDATEEDYINNVIYLGKWSFAFNSFVYFSMDNCSNLHEIDEYAFAYCVEMEDVSFPNSLQVARKYSFYKCQLLNKLYYGKGLAKLSTYYLRKTINNLIFNANPSDGQINHIDMPYYGITKLGYWTWSGWHPQIEYGWKTYSFSVYCGYFEKYSFMSCLATSSDPFKLEVEEKQELGDVVDDEVKNAYYEVRAAFGKEYYFKEAGELFFRIYTDNFNDRAKIYVNGEERYTIKADNNVFTWSEVSST